MQPYISYFFYVLCALSAAGMLFTKDVLKAALLLLLSLLSVASLYVVMNAEMVAVAQILVYAGGIVIVIIFGIMLTTKMTGQPLKVTNGNILAGAISFASLFFILAKSLATIPNTVTERNSSDRITETGKLLMTDYVLPFELAGILLLIALVGAAIVSTSGVIKRRS